jgi:hypothetical protein
MLRQNRWSIRISFILVIIAATFGLWYANAAWESFLPDLDLTGLSENTDWVEVVAGMGEAAVQLLLGATSGS